jgi:glucokinase
MKSAMTDDVLAIDVGGTKLAVALVGPEGEVRGSAMRPTPQGGDSGTVWAALEAALADLGGAGDVATAGIGSAGPVDAAAGTVSPVNIPAWRDFPIVARLSELLPGSRVVLCGDAVAVAAGEYLYGAGRGARSLLGMVVSTGVGGGLVLNGRVYAGATGNAGHIGHTVVDLNGEPCRCGSRGCVETIASGTAMVRWALDQGWVCDAPSGAALSADARAGSAVAIATYERAGAALAAGISSAAALCELDRVVIGGGVARSWDLLAPAVAKGLGVYAGLEFVRRAEVVPAALADSAGLVGAAALARSPELLAGDDLTWSR